MGQTASVGDSLFNEGKLTAALAQYKQDYNNTSSQSDKAKYALQIGILHQLENDFEEADNLFTKSLSHQPGNGLAFLHKAMLYFIKSTKEQCAQFSQFVDSNMAIQISKGTQTQAGIGMCIMAILVTYHKVERSEKRAESYLSMATDLLDFSNPNLWLTKIVLGLTTQELEKEIQSIVKSLAQAPPTSYYKVWDERGKSLLLNHNFKQSLGCFNMCMAISPMSYEAILYAALVLFDSNQKMKSLHMFEYITEVLNPKCSNAWMHRGHICMELNDYEKAAYSYSKFVEHDPTNAFAWERQAAATLKCEWPNAATEALQCASNAVHLSTLNIKGLILKGKCLIKLEMYSDAIKVFDSILHKKRNEPEALTLKANVHKTIHQYDKAAELYEKVLQKIYNNKKIWCNYAECLLYLERFDEGIEATEHALIAKIEEIEHVPDDFVPIIPQVWEFIVQETFKKKDEVHPVVKVKPSMDLQAWIIRSMLLWKSHRYEEAIIAINHTLSLDTQSATAWDIKGHILSHFENRGDESLTCFKKASELDPRNPLTIQSIVSLYCIMKQYDLAFEFCQKLLDITPNDTFALHSYANCLFFLGRYKEAIDFINSKRELENDVACKDIVLKSLRMMGDYEGELQMYDKILSKDTTNIKVLLKRGRCHMLTGNMQKAKSDFKFALASKHATFKAKAYLGLCLLLAERNRYKGVKILEQLKKKDSVKFDKWKHGLKDSEIDSIDEALVEGDIDNVEF